MMLSDDQLDELNKALLSRLSELEALSGDREQSAKPVELDQQSFGRVSRIDSIQQQQMAKSHQANAEKEVVMIKLALNKIESGDYG